MVLPDLTEIHDRYLLLSHIAREHSPESLTGKLLLRSSFDAKAIADLIAASVAGAASLCVDSHADLLHQGLRAGVCDFVVGHLDEALRILKNQIRKASPVSVCLAADPEQSLNALAERGVQPDLMSPASSHAYRIFVERGAMVLPAAGAADATISALIWTAGAARVLPQIAQLASQALDPARPDTPARRHWLHAAPRYLGRTFGQRQVLRMTEEESAAFLPRLRSAFPSVSLTLDGAAI